LAPEDAEASGFTIVGRCEEGTGAEIRRDGRTLEVDGWTHFG